MEKNIIDFISVSIDRSDTERIYLEAGVVRYCEESVSILEFLRPCNVEIPAEVIPVVVI